MQNLSELSRRLIEAQVEFVLIGGFAAVAHGGTLVTRDVDICCQFSQAARAGCTRAKAISRGDPVIVACFAAIIWWQDYRASRCRGTHRC